MIIELPVYENAGFGAGCLPRLRLLGTVRFGIANPDVWLRGLARWPIERANTLGQLARLAPLNLKEKRIWWGLGGDEWEEGHGWWRNLGLSDWAKTTEEEMRYWIKMSEVSVLEFLPTF
jgi:hypothetical protein